jgi:nucleolar protein 56
MYLITKWFGTFLFDNNKILKKKLFKNDPDIIAKKMIAIDNMEILEEEKQIILKKSVKVNEKRLQDIGDYCPNDKFFKKINLDFNDFGFSLETLKKSSYIVANSKSIAILSSKDMKIIQMVNNLDDLIMTINLLNERKECWLELPDCETNLKSLNELIKYIRTESLRLEIQIEKSMKEIAPNMTNIIGPLIGARLISLSGSINRLAKMPASTIQLLGAEKAFFRFKKEGGNPPKHGIIFQHPLINKSPKSQRGKIARSFANKISTACKADVFTKNDISDLLKNELNKRIKEIRNL